MDTALSVLQEVRYSVKGSEPFCFWIKRDDLIDLVISGNKWRKLKYNLQKAGQLGGEGVLTFGGAFSNHLLATAKACSIKGYNSVGIVRGEELNNESNETLRGCTSYGMGLQFVSREEYKQKEEEGYIRSLKDNYPGYFVVPEGGANYYGAIGCQEIVNELPHDFDHFYLAGGTGTSATGILSALPARTKLHLVSVLKGNFLRKEVEKGLNRITYDPETSKEILNQFHLNTNHHFGGYGKVNDELIDFINDFYSQTNIPLDPIYTGKAVYALIEDFKVGRINREEKTLFLHTGGLQGAKKWSEQLLFSVW